MSKHIANEKQRKAFDKVISAIKAANKTGLVIYAKSQSLVAYTKQADHYVEEEHGFENCLRGRGYQIPNLSQSILADSGADDFPCYITMEDNNKFNPDHY